MRRKTIIPMSLVWALVIAVVVGVWMASGEVVIGGRVEADAKNGEPIKVAAKTPTDAENIKTGAATEGKKLFRVRTRTFVASPRRAYLTLRGRTEADAIVHVRAETAGIVEAISPKKGAIVSKGELLCRIEPGARQANILEAEAMLADAKADYDAADKLAKRGHTATLKVMEYRAKQDSAKAQLARAELDMKRTIINAPIRGVLHEQAAKTGDYLSVGGSCATLVANDPLLIVGAVAEHDVSHLTAGMDAEAALVTGEKVQGQIRYVSPASDPRTRTFRVEIEVSNPDYKLRDGVTADIRVPLQAELAHQVTRAILTLNDDGEIGVRTIVHGNRVKFVPVKILGDGPQGFWVGGLAERVRIITVGQEYVIDGQTVIAVEEPAQTSALPGVEAR